MTGALPADPFAATGSGDREAIYDAPSARAAVHRVPLPGLADAWRTGRRRRR